jgi:hypothetical protein
LFENGIPENVQEFGQTAADLQFLFDDGDQDIDTDGNSRLCLDGIF